MTQRRPVTIRRLLLPVAVGCPLRNQQAPSRATTWFWAS
jgi:hypothetical protein